VWLSALGRPSDRMLSFEMSLCNNYHPVIHIWKVLVSNLGPETDYTG
jgi:hypothetical protein